MLLILSNEGNTYPNNVEHANTPVTVATSNTTVGSAGKDGRREAFIHWWDGKLVQRFRKQVWKNLKELKISTIRPFQTIPWHILKGLDII